MNFIGSKGREERYVNMALAAAAIVPSSSIDIFALCMTSLKDRFWSLVSSDKSEVLRNRSPIPMDSKI